MQCRSNPAGIYADEIGEELHEVLGWGFVGEPAGDTAVVRVERGEQHHGAVTLILEPRRVGTPGTAGLVGLTRDLACIPDFAFDAPHHGVLGRIEV